MGRRKTLIAICAGLLMALSLNSLARAGDRDHAATAWNQAFVALPSSLTGRPLLGRMTDPEIQNLLGQLAVTTVSNAPLIPAVIFMHGCDGMGREGQAYRYLLSLNDMAMFAPDSFAAVDRRANCDTSRHSTSQFPEAEDRRDRELQYAIDAVKRLPGFDPERIYLAGFSEGAVAVARYQGNDVAGLIITGWHCHGNAKNTGIQSGKKIPVLAIVGADDPWYRSKTGLDCGTYLAGRPHSESVALPNNGHRIVTSPDIDNARTAKQLILRFLQHEPAG